MSESMMKCHIGAGKCDGVPFWLPYMQSCENFMKVHLVAKKYEKVPYSHFYVWVCKEMTLCVFENMMKYPKHTHAYEKVR